MSNEKQFKTGWGRIDLEKEKPERGWKKNWTWLTDEVKQKLSSEDLDTIERESKEINEWLESHQIQETSVEDYQEKKKEIESKLMPIMTKLYQGANVDPAAAAAAQGMPAGMEGMTPEMMAQMAQSMGAAGGMPGGVPATGSAEPQIEEID